MKRERIQEEDDQIEIPLRDHRADLRVTAAWATEQRAQGGADRVGHELGGVSRAAELRIAEQRAVPSGPLDHVLLLSIVRDERDALSCVHDDTVGTRPVPLQGTQRVPPVKSRNTIPSPHHDVPVTARTAERGYGRLTFHSILLPPPPGPAVR